MSQNLLNKQISQKSNTLETTSIHLQLTLFTSSHRLQLLCSFFGRCYPRLRLSEKPLHSLWEVHKLIIVDLNSMIPSDHHLPYISSLHCLFPISLDCQETGQVNLVLLICSTRENCDLKRLMQKKKKIWGCVSRHKQLTRPRKRWEEGFLWKLQKFR